MKRVLHILPHRGGGGETYVTMLESAPGYVHERAYLSAGRTPRSAVSSMPPRLTELLRGIRRADLVHVHGDTTSLVVTPLVATRPTVMTTHGLHLLRRSSGRAESAVKLGLRAAVAASNAVIATSTSESEDLLGLVRVKDRGKLRVVLNGVPTPRPVSQARRAQIRTELGVSPDTILGLFAGELEARKQPLLAAAATARVSDQGLPFVLAFAGDGPLMKALAGDAGRAVRVLGFRSDLDQLMAAADVFVHPASREGMSLAVLEAMSHGLAVIAADVPGNSEALAGTGRLFPPGDESALAVAIEQVCRYEELRRDLGNLAGRRAAIAFGPRRFETDTLSTYASVLTVPGPDGGAAIA